MQNIAAKCFELVPILPGHKCAFLSPAIHEIIATAVRSRRSLGDHSRLAAKRIDHPTMLLKLTQCRQFVALAALGLYHGCFGVGQKIC